MRGTKMERAPGVWRLRVVTGYKPNGRPSRSARRSGAPSARHRVPWHDSSPRQRRTERSSRAGRVVSVAAVIMVGALGGLVGGRVAGLHELGAGLALGVLVDATVVRGLLMPGLMVWAGRWNWWLPAGAARFARVQASPLAEHGGPALSTDLHN